MNIMRKGNKRNKGNNFFASDGNNKCNYGSGVNKKPGADNLKANMPGNRDQVIERANMPRFDPMPKDNVRVNLAKKTKASNKDVMQMFSYKNNKGGLEFSLKRISIMSNRPVKEVEKLFEEYKRRNKH